MLMLSAPGLPGSGAGLRAAGAAADTQLSAQPLGRGRREDITDSKPTILRVEEGKLNSCL